LACAGSTFQPKPGRSLSWTAILFARACTAGLMAFFDSPLPLIAAAAAPVATRAATKTARSFTPVI
jgi:hypothetical protein